MLRETFFLFSSDMKHAKSFQIASFCVKAFLLFCCCFFLQVSLHLSYSIAFTLSLYLSLSLSLSIAFVREQKCKFLSRLSFLKKKKKSTLCVFLSLSLSPLVFLALSLPVSLSHTHVTAMLSQRIKRLLWVKERNEKSKSFVQFS